VTAKAKAKAHDLEAVRREIADVTQEVEGCTLALADATNDAERDALVQDRASLVARREALVALLDLLQGREREESLAVVEAAHAKALAAMEKAQEKSAAAAVEVRAAQDALRRMVSVGASISDQTEAKVRVVRAEGEALLARRALTGARHRHRLAEKDLQTAKGETPPTPALVGSKVGRPIRSLWHGGAKVDG